MLFSTWGSLSKCMIDKINWGPRDLIRSHFFGFFIGQKIVLKLSKIKWQKKLTISGSLIAPNRDSILSYPSYNNQASLIHFATPRIHTKSLYLMIFDFNDFHIWIWRNDFLFALDFFYRGLVIWLISGGGCQGREEIIKR